MILILLLVTLILCFFQATIRDVDLRNLDVLNLRFIETKFINVMFDENESYLTRFDRCTFIRSYADDSFIDSAAIKECNGTLLRYKK